MVPTFGLVVQAILFALGMYWCYEVFGRWRSDLEIVRETDDTTRRLVVVGMWVLTLGIAILVVYFAISIITRIVSGVIQLI